MKGNLPVIILGIFYVTASIFSASDGGDFDVYLDAAQKLANGQNIYQPPFIKGLQYYYSPFFALILIPLSNHFFLTELVWLLLSGVMLYRTWVLISMNFNTHFLDSKYMNLWMLISFFFILRFVLYNIAMIQITIFLLWAILESIQLIKNGKIFLGAGILALAINIKIIPIVIMPYLIYRGYFKSVALIIIFSFLFLILPAIFIGYDANLFLLSEWWSIINPINSEHVIETDITYQSLVGTIPVFLTETESIVPIARNFMNLSVETVTTITNVSRILVVLFTLYFLGYPFPRKSSKLADFRAISYILLAVPLIFPHQQKYAFLFMYPMISYLFYYSLLKWKWDRTLKFKIFLFVGLAIFMVFTPLIGSDIIGRYPYDVIQHFKILGISAILLIPLAFFASPKTMEELVTKNEIHLN